MTIAATLARLLAGLIAALGLGLTLAAPGSPLAFLSVSSEAPALTIQGRVDGLAPGAPGSLRLTVTNPGAEPALVRELTARVTGASSGCAPRTLVVTPWRGELAVPAGGAATVALPIRLVDAPAACRGATWQLAYTSR